MPGTPRYLVLPTSRYFIGGARAQRIYEYEPPRARSSRAGLGLGLATVGHTNPFCGPPLGSARGSGIGVDRRRVIFYGCNSTCGIL